MDQYKRSRPKGRLRAFHKIHVSNCLLKFLLPTTVLNWILLKYPYSHILLNVKIFMLSFGFKNSSDAEMPFGPMPSHCHNSTSDSNAKFSSVLLSFHEHRICLRVNPDLFLSFKNYQAFTKRNESSLRNFLKFILKWLYELRLNACLYSLSS